MAIMLLVRASGEFGVGCEQACLKRFQAISIVTACGDRRRKPKGTASRARRSFAVPVDPSDGGGVV